jgi:membrane protease YdiL (CAAX protease family)
MSAVHQGRGAAVAAALVYAALWGVAVYYLYAAGNEDGATTAALVMAVFGLALSGLAWLLTLGAKAPPIEVKRPALESGALVVYLAIYAVGFLGYGMSAARAAFPPGQEQEVLVLGLKLAVHVVAPVLLLLALGVRLGPLFQAGLNGRKFWRTLIVLGAIFLALLCVISPSLHDIAATQAPWTTLAWVAPVSFVWIAVEAGLNEEFLFRAVLQTRLSALFKSPWAGVIVTSLLFGLGHAPGLFLRGGPDVDGWSSDPLQVIAYTIAVLSPMGLLFGLIYARTKSLLLVVLLHALIDVLPNMAEFIRIWA